MSAKKWLLVFSMTVLLLAALVAGVNALVDPFGVFGDPIFQWWSYDETNNPRTAKFSYLERHHQEYDSYIVGCSSTSSFPTDRLNQYFDAKFYNMISYGADMLDAEQTCRYLLENYTVKHLVVNVYISNGQTYDTGEDDLTRKMPSKASGSNPISYYASYLFADLRYAKAKLQARGEDEYLPRTFDVFDEETGTYDKRKRDAEPIGDLERYLAAYPVFSNYTTDRAGLTSIRECVESVRRIVELCQEKGVDLTVVCSPVYSQCLYNYYEPQVRQFYTALAEVTPYWDFTMSSVSFEPRYFYDDTHFRNCVGDMALARIFHDEAVYVPEDFGVYVTKENVAQHLDTFWTCGPPEPEAFTAQVPILLYHHITEDVTNDMMVSPEQFERQIRTLAEHGYTAVSLEELRAYVYEGAELPDKPICITFDDGYESNYEYAFPVLQQYGMKATIFVIGSSVGKDTYKETGQPIVPHFDAAQAREMVDSGLISIQSHTFDMHQSSQYETSDLVRGTILIHEGEDQWAYAQALKADSEKIRTLVSDLTGQIPEAMAYPAGYWDTLSQAVLQEAGFTMTMGTAPGVNTLVRGMGQSLLTMHRDYVYETTTPEELLALVAQARG